MKISDFKTGDYATFIHNKLTSVACMTDDCGSFEECVSLPHGEISRNSNLYTLEALGDDISGTIRSSTYIEIKFYEKTLSDWEKENPQIYELPSAKLRGLKVVTADPDVLKRVNDTLEERKAKEAKKIEKMEKKQEKKNEIQLQQEKTGVTGYTPQKHEIVGFERKVKGESIRRGVAIAYDSFHFYVACGLYGDGLNVTTINQPHPDELEDGAFPRGTVLFNITKNMVSDVALGNILKEKYAEDIEKYDALVEHRRLEEQNKKEIEERIANAKKQYDEYKRICPVPKEQLVDILQDNTKYSIDYPLTNSFDFSHKLIGLSNFYCIAQAKPYIYAVSPAYREHMEYNFDNNIAELKNKSDILVRQEGGICLSTRSQKVITILYAVRTHKFHLAVLHEDNLILTAWYEMDKANFDFKQITGWSTKKDNKSEKADIRQSALFTALSFIYDRYVITQNILNYTDTTERDAEMDKYFKPNEGESYIKRTVTIPDIILPTDGTIKETKVESYSQIKWKRVEGLDELQPVRSQVSGYTKLFANTK